MSTSLGDAAYVACGKNGLMLNSVERLGMGLSEGSEAQAWTIIDIPQLTPRSFPVFNQIGPDQLCILGGGMFYVEKSDGVILNVKTQ